MALTQSGSTRDRWSSRSAFMLAAIGSALGLGSIWRFPAEAGANGGGALVLFYLLCVLLIGLPILLAEALIGRHGKAAAPESVRRVASASRASPLWGTFAGLGVFSAFLILCLLCVVGGWVLHFIGLFAGDLLRSGVSGGAFAGYSAEQVEGLFPALTGSGGKTVWLALLFLGATLFFVARGVSGGIELAARWLMPAFFVLLLGFALVGLFGGGFGRAFDYLFTFDAQRLTGPVMLAAAGQACASLALGVAGMITYGSYVGRNVNLAGTSALIAGGVIAATLLGGLAVLAIVFAAGLPVDSGWGLLFQSVPLAFQSMPFGAAAGLAFCVMLLCASLMGSVALLEVPTAWLIDRHRIVRRFSAGIVAFFAVVPCVLAALSFNLLAGWHPLGLLPMFEGQGFFEVIYGLTTRLFMPFGAILTALFVGWVADRKLVNIENGIGGLLHLAWLALVRFVCPLALAGSLALTIFPELLA